MTGSGRGYGNRKADHVDKYIGERIKARRLILQMSQSELANRIGVTFQQVQKLEQGDNRIAGSRLYRTAKALAVKPGFFFEGLAATTDEMAASDPMKDATNLEVVRLLGKMDCHAVTSLIAMLRNLTTSSVAA